MKEIHSSKDCLNKWREGGERGIKEAERRRDVEMGRRGERRDEDEKGEGWEWREEDIHIFIFLLCQEADLYFHYKMYLGQGRQMTTLNYLSHYPLTWTARISRQAASFSKSKHLHILPSPVRQRLQRFRKQKKSGCPPISPYWQNTTTTCIYIWLYPLPNHVSIVMFL